MRAFLRMETLQVAQQTRYQLICMEKAKTRKTDGLNTKWTGRDRAGREKLWETEYDRQSGLKGFSTQILSFSYENNDMILHDFGVYGHGTRM